MKFENSVVICQPIGQVFEFVTNLENNANWQTDVEDLEITSENSSGKGAAYRCINRFMGKRIESEGVVSDYVPERRCHLKITSGALSAECTMQFEEVENGTKLIVSGTYDPGIFSLLKAMVARKVNHQMKKDMMRLKNILENGHRL